MVTVRELISELKKLPQSLPVGVAMHDNDEFETAGWVAMIDHTTDNFDPENKIECVILHC